MLMPRAKIACNRIEIMSPIGSSFKEDPRQSAEQRPKDEKQVAPPNVLEAEKKKGEEKRKMRGEKLGDFFKLAVHRRLRSRADRGGGKKRKK